MNAPDVYVQEQSGLLAPELSRADTIAAFIGYTEKGPLLTPTRLRSLREYEKLFGQAEVTDFGVDVNTRSGEPASYALLSPPWLAYYMYYSVQLYFANGGGECQVVSVGSYGGPMDVDQLLAGLNKLQTVEVDLLLGIYGAKSAKTLNPVPHILTYDGEQGSTEQDCADSFQVFIAHPLPGFGGQVMPYDKDDGCTYQQEDEDKDRIHAKCQHVPQFLLPAVFLAMTGSIQFLFLQRT